MSQKAILLLLLFLSENFALDSDNFYYRDFLSKLLWRIQSALAGYYSKIISIQLLENFYKFSRSRRHTRVKFWLKRVIGCFLSPFLLPLIKIVSKFRTAPLTDRSETTQNVNTAVTSRGFYIVEKPLPTD